MDKPALSATLDEHDEFAFDSAIDLDTERANLYPLSINPLPGWLYVEQTGNNGKTSTILRFSQGKDAEPVLAEPHRVRSCLRGRLLASLERAGYRLDERGKVPVVLDTTGVRPHKGPLRIYPAYALRVMSFSERYFLCLDHKLRTQSLLTLDDLRKHENAFSPNWGQRIFYRDPASGEWIEGTFAEADGDEFIVDLASGDRVQTQGGCLVPYLDHGQILRFAEALQTSTHLLERTIKQLSYLIGSAAPRARLGACTEFARRLSQTAFPIYDGKTVIRLDPLPVSLRPPLFALATDLREPEICFDRVDKTKRGLDITRGLTRYGTYEKAVEPVRLTVISTNDRFALMKQLVARLNSGSLNYAGAQSTFGSSFVVRETIVCGNVQQYESAIREFAHTDARSQTDVALVYLPETGDVSSSDHPYYRTKRLLLREGIASQMADEATVRDPNYRDLNLALNIYAKAGHTPWILDQGIEGVDLFIGLSWSSLRHGQQIVRMMGYVNVFDSFGRWRFYRGNSTSFGFEDRIKHFEQLVEESIFAHRAENGGPLNSVCFHLTKPFSQEERAVLAAALRRAAPGARVSFVWIDRHQILRMYDLSQGSAGEIRRATYLREDPGLVYLATTGSNEFGQRGMGTPVLLQMVVWADPLEETPDLSEVAQQVLSLTRLNWGSSRNFCQEPITTKYAGMIARQMNRFMADPDFRINPILRSAPWFL